MQERNILSTKLEKKGEEKTVNSIWNTHTHAKLTFTLFLEATSILYILSNYLRSFILVFFSL